MRGSETMLLSEIRLNQIKNDATATTPRGTGQETGVAGGAAGASSLFSAYVDTSNTIFTNNGLRTGDTLYGKKDLAEDALSNAMNTNTAAMSDTAMKNQMVAKATADLSAGDVQAAGEEGFSYKNMNPEELVTVGGRPGGRPEEDSGKCSRVGFCFHRYSSGKGPRDSGNFR